MKLQYRKNKKYNRIRRIATAGGVVVNVFLAFLTYKSGLPLYLDCIGTMGVAAICGISPGVLVAVLTNFFCGLFNEYSFYYVFISVAIAMTTSYFVGIGKIKKGKGYIFLYILIVSFIGGTLGTVFQWILIGDNQFQNISETAESISAITGWSYFAASMVANLGLNLVDKTVCVLVVLGVSRFIPKEELLSIWNSGWRQKPLSKEEIKNNGSLLQKGERSIRTKMVIAITLTVFSVAVVMSWISVTQYIRTTREEYTKSAISTAYAAAGVVNGNRVDEFLKQGELARGYNETKSTLYLIRNSSTDVKYLYVMKIEKDGCHVVMDLDSEDAETLKTGEVIPFEEAFEPYLDALFAGEEIEPIESTNGISGWVLTAYAPIKDSEGQTVAYVGADVEMDALPGYVLHYITEVLMIFSGFFLLVLSLGIWMTNVNIVHPITSLVAWTDEFATHSKSQEDLDHMVRKLRDIDIYTDDEIEKLYRSLCRMAVDTANQVRDINYFADSTSKMQNGLIVTMADMVENRDSDTGAHVQKTAAYVKIIAESLKKNGYYVEKLTPKYMQDVVMSAPLHDVGKINISDTILNKPGKLTDEEYEIMKTHTTFGKEIMEKAIATVEGENYLKEARNMAAYHHERWDGKGYPEGLRGEVIPLSARIMAVADVFDALTSPRVYKPAFPLEKALAIMEEGSGTQFDPKCINAFLTALPEVKLVLKKYQDM